MSSGSTTVHNIEINYITKGLDVYSTQANSAAIASTKITDSSSKAAINVKGVGDSFTKSGSAVKTYTGALGGLDPVINRAVGGLTKKNTVLGSSVNSYNNAAGAATNLSGKISGFSNSILPLVSRISGATFMFVGLTAAMGEAQGMQEILAISQKKVSDLQAEQNALVLAGQEGSKEYKRVTNELEQAQAALTRQQTITNLSTQDTYFFIGALISQAVPAAIKGISKLTEITSKSEKGFGAIADIMGGKVKGAVVGLAEKLGLMPPLFTSAGTSANTFGAALKLIALNPFTIAIAAATTLLTLFVTNAFGVRDAIYGIGKAIGDAVPFLKPLLDGLKTVGDTVVSIFGGQIPEAAAETNTAMDEFNKKLSETEIHVLEVSKGIEILSDYAIEWNHLKDVLGGTNQTVIDFKTNFDNMNKAIEEGAINTTEEVSNLIDFLEGMQVAAAESAPEIVEAINSIIAALANPEGKERQEALAKSIGNLKVVIEQSKGPTEEATKTFVAYAGASLYAGRYVTELAKLHKIELNPSLLKSQSTTFALMKALNELGTETLEVDTEFSKFILTYREWSNASTEVQNNLKNSIFLVKEFGNSVVLNKNGIVDVTASMIKLTEQQKEYGLIAQSIWNKHQTDIESGKISLDSFGAYIEAVKQKNEGLGEALEVVFKNYQDGVKDAQKGTKDWTKDYNKLIAEILRTNTEGTPAINKFAEALSKLDKGITGALEKLRDKGIEAVIKAIDKDKPLDKVLDKMKLDLSKTEKLNLLKEVFIFDVGDSEDKVTSFVEGLAKMIASKKGFTVKGGNKLMEGIFDGMKDVAGKDKSLVEEIKKWEVDFKNVGSLNGEAYNEAFIEFAISHFADQAGTIEGLVGVFGVSVVKGVINKMKEKNPDLKIAGLDMGDTITEGAGEGLAGIPESIDSDVTPAVKDSMVLMTAEAIGLVNTMLSDEVDTTIPGYIPLFTTAFTNLGSTALSFVNEAIKHLGQFNLILSNETSVTMPGFVKLFNDQFLEMGKSVTTLVDTTKTQMKQFNDAITASEGRLNDFTNKSLSNLVKLRTGFGNFGSEVSQFKTQFIKDMDSAESKFQSFTSKMLANLVKLRTGFGNATTQAEELRKAIDKLKDKTITVTTKYVTEGKPGNRFGGSFINSVPTHIGGKAISEGFKPELVTITPLTDPHTNDTEIDFGALKPNLSERRIDTGLVSPINQIVDSRPNLPAIAGGGSIPNTMIVKGLMQVNLTLSNGRVLAKTIMPYMMEGMAGSL